MRYYFEKGGKQERVENMEAKDLPKGRTLTTTILSLCGLANKSLTALYQQKT